MKRMNAGWLTDIEQKSFDLQISVIKSAKINRYFKENAGQLSDTDAKSAESKRKKHWLMLKKHSEDLLKQSL
jgi:hypothetical protein